MLILFKILVKKLEKLIIKFWDWFNEKIKWRIAKIYLLINKIRKYRQYIKLSVRNNLSANYRLKVF